MNIDKKSSGYDTELASEWANWVEGSEGKNRDELFSLINQWLENKKPETLIDLGCGQGVCSSLVSDSTKYIGIDLSEDLIKKALIQYNKPNNKFICASVYDVPMDKESADSLMSIWVWSHLTDLPKASNEMYRLLKPNGTFLIITANPATYKTRKTYYKEYKDYGDHLVGTFDLGNGKYLTNTTLQFHTIDHISDAITSSGLKIDSKETFGLFEDDPRGMYLDIRGHKE